jgi:DNA-binding response OmpR family regulator
MPPSAKAPRRCLVADDEPQIGSLVRDALAPSGYAADVVQDGEAAARRLARQDYALLVSDDLMPHKTGLELVRELRGRGEEIPIVLMSSFLSDEALRACRTLGRIAFLQKPFSLTDLRGAIDRAMSPVRR